MEQKFKRGFRVEILSRQIRGESENTTVGCDAIIEYSSIEKNDERIDESYHRDEPCYHLLILQRDGSVRSLHWFEEKYLELVCRNEEKGKAILAKHGK